MILIIANTVRKIVNVPIMGLEPVSLALKCGTLPRGLLPPRGSDGKVLKIEAVVIYNTHNKPS